MALVTRGKGVTRRLKAQDTREQPQFMILDDGILSEKKCENLRIVTGLDWT